MKVPTKLKLAETIQVAILKITISRAFGTSQAIGDSDPPVNWWAIPRMSLQDKRQHPKQTPKTRSKTTFKTNPVSRNFRLPKEEWKPWSPSVRRAIGLETTQFDNQTILTPE